jgi:hypothetical protein
VAALLIAILAGTEAVLGPAQDLSRGGAGDPARITVSISLVVWALAGVSTALLAVGFGLSRSLDARWPIPALAVAAALFALSGALLAIGWLVGWQPAVLLGLVNVPALLLLVTAWARVGQMSRRASPLGRRRMLPLAELGLGAALFVLAAAGAGFVPVVAALFVLGWIAIAVVIWSDIPAMDRATTG